MRRVGLCRDCALGGDRAGGVVVLVSGNVFEVVDDVPANIDIYTDLGAARQQAATALAAKILSHLQPAA